MAERSAEEKNQQATSSATLDNEEANLPKSPEKGKKQKKNSAEIQPVFDITLDSDSSDDEPLLFNVVTPELPSYVPYSQRPSVEAMVEQDDNANAISVKKIVTNEREEEARQCTSTGAIVSPITAKLADAMLKSPTVKAKEKTTPKPKTPVIEISSTDTDENSDAKGTSPKKTDEAQYEEISVQEYVQSILQNAIATG